MHTYPKEIADFIADNVKGITSTELTKMVNNTFGTSYGKNHIRAYMKNHKLTNGLNTRFKKGEEPPNKGQKGICSRGCEKTWFQNGNTPANHRPVGSERVDRDGYTLVKVAEPRTWELKHRVVWEEHHGKIPKNHVIIFMDGNKRNLDISNLTLITRNELKIMNQQGLKSEVAAITETGVLIARLIDKKNKVYKNKSK